MRNRTIWIILVFQLSFLLSGFAQEVPSTGETKPNTSNGIPSTNSSDSGVTIRRLPSNLLYDQKHFWTSPARIRSNDLKWIVPLGFATAGAFGIDHAVERKLPTSLSTIKHASSLSNYGALAFAGIAGTQYLWGLHKQEDRARETGLLSGEAAIDAVLITEFSKVISARERPVDGNGQGRFFESNNRLSSSFPSQHAALAWSIATVLAHEYPGVLAKVLAYGGATGIGAARIIGKDHFTSDVFIGSAIGYFVGREVYKSHSADTSDKSNYGVFESSDTSSSHDRTAMMGSTYVALDSWIYPMFDRLNALGLTRDAIIGARPWTRMKCAQLLDNLTINGVQVSDADPLPPEAKSMIDQLREEFASELSLIESGANLDLTVDSVYTRFTAISDLPLHDALHFGQTVTNDLGRPYSEGLNNVSGISARAEAGPFAFYVRGEYQHAPSGAAYSLATRTALASFDRLPVMPGVASDEINRLRFLESYVAVNVKDFQLSFGKQSLGWGPGRTTDMMMSSNAEPFNMLRLSTSVPIRIPLISAVLGPFESTTFIGQLQGYQFLRLGNTFQLTGSWDRYINPQPYIWGEHLNFKPTENFEFGVSITSVFAGLGLPATLDAFRHTFSSNGNAQSIEPGDRRTGFEFNYRVPKLRRWLTIYGGSMAEDEPLPLFYPRRSGWNPGIYLVQFPKLNKLDLRVEAVYSDLPNLKIPGYFYNNLHYAGGYTNNGNIIGSWIGPEGRAIEVRSNYWISPVNRITAGFRSQRNNPEFLQGGEVRQFTGQYSFMARRRLQITGSVQYERWSFPTIDSSRHSDTTTAIELKWKPPALFR